MLAQRIQFYVLDDHHVVVVGVEHRIVKYSVQILTVATTQIGHGLGCALWGLGQAFPVETLAETFEDPGVKCAELIDLHACLVPGSAKRAKHFTGMGRPIPCMLVVDSIDLDQQCSRHQDHTKNRQDDR